MGRYTNCLAIYVTVSAYAALGSRYKVSFDSAEAGELAVESVDTPDKCYCPVHPRQNGVGIYQKTASFVLGPNGHACLNSTKCTDCSRHGRACCDVNPDGSSGKCGDVAFQKLDFENKRCVCGAHFEFKANIRAKRNPGCIPSMSCTECDSKCKDAVEVQLAADAPCCSTIENAAERRIAAGNGKCKKCEEDTALESGNDKVALESFYAPDKCYCPILPSQMGVGIYQKSASGVLGPNGHACLNSTECTDCSRHGRACCLVNPDGSSGKCGDVAFRRLDFENKRCVCGRYYENKANLRKRNPACVPEMSCTECDSKCKDAIELEELADDAPCCSTIASVIKRRIAESNRKCKKDC